MSDTKVGEFLVTDVSTRLASIMKQIEFLEAEVSTLHYELYSYYESLETWPPKFTFGEAQNKMTLLFTKVIALEHYRAQSFEQAVREKLAKIKREQS